MTGAIPSTPVVASLWRYDADTVGAMAAPHGVSVLEPSPGVATTDLVRNADIVLADPSGERALTGDVIAAMRNCRLIQQPSVGLDTIDLAAAAAHGVPVANTAGSNSRSVAEWVLMATMTLLRDAHRSHAAMADGDWPRPDPGRELGALTVGLVGMGGTARAVAHLLAGVGSPVLFHHRRSCADPPDGARQVPLDELLRDSDVVSLHVPLGPATTGLLGADRLSLMKTDAVLVNTSRGPVVDEAALVDWLAAAPDRRAALDVFDVEPLPPRSPLRSTAQVLLSPHAAARTVDARRRLDDVVAQNLRRALSGREILHLVDTAGGPS
ncbi:D-3-phosphoglycerate dehydrogenase [Haloactinopolyspora alba]|uniref:D-3-phosphoglycerate dehydrogenase n=1 Tax=Haloactinopolyspora alba TaxID=648780 RepID=A0A2P8DVU0_9ACTN|nr:NAD(P)-dependent oxidoreductase [Haloactinopolyspora alba]PSL01287.1 D-3-phosphoglycerate dehydrogenase [Haloactinopolyspora alba]